MRLTVALDGTLAVDGAAARWGSPVWRVRVAEARLASGDPWLRVKTTERRVYDAARDALPAGIDEVLFLNERGEVCDGTITSVFVDAGGALVTPPLRCGLLPGVLREEMLAEGLCREGRSAPGLRRGSSSAIAARADPGAAGGGLTGRGARGVSARDASEELAMHPYRSHTCAELDLGHAGQTVRLAGWVHRKRDHGGLLFIDLRDHYGITQLVVDGDSPAFAAAEAVRAEWVIRVDGLAKARAPQLVNPKIQTGGIEVYVERAEVLEEEEKKVNIQRRQGSSTGSSTCGGRAPPAAGRGTGT